MSDNTPIYDVLFDLEMSLCDRFPSMTPLSLRREKAREVFTLVNRFNRHSKKKKKNFKNGKQIIRKPAGDNWF